MSFLQCQDAIDVCIGLQKPTTQYSRRSEPIREEATQQSESFDVIREIKFLGERISRHSLVGHKGNLDEQKCLARSNMALSQSLHILKPSGWRLNIMDNIKQRLLAQAFKRNSWDIPTVPKPFSPPKTARPLSLPFNRVQPISPVRPARTSMPLFPQNAPSEVFTSDSEESPSLSLVAKPSNSKRPVAFLMLQAYVREVCSEIERSNNICRDTLKKASLMQKALNDAAQEIPSMSIFFYNLAKSVLQELSGLKEHSDYTDLLSKLMEMAAFIAEKRYRSKEHPVHRYQVYISEPLGQQTYEEVKLGLRRRLENLNPKTLSIVGSIARDNPQVEKVAAAFVVLADFLDPSLFSRPGADPVTLVSRLTQIPNRLIRATHKVLTESVPRSLLGRVEALIRDVELKSLKCKEKSGAGVVLYEMLAQAIKYLRFPVWQAELTTSSEKPEKPKRKNSVDAYKPRCPIEESHKKRRSGSIGVLSDSDRRGIFESILRQQKLSFKFREFLKEIIWERGSEPETLKQIEAERGAVAKAFAERFGLDKRQCEHLGKERLFSEHLRMCSRLLNQYISSY